MTDLVSNIVVVDGASGYVGSHLVHELNRRQIPVRALVHETAHPEDCRFLASCQAGLFKSEINAASPVLAQCLSGARALVHLIGSIAPGKGQKLEDLHAGLTAELIAACRQSRPKIIMITALGTAVDADSLYHRSKWQAEELLRASGLDYVILRPSLIVGRQVGRRDSKLVARYINLIETRKRVPLIGGGKNLLQPVFIGDLCSAVIKAIGDDSLNGQTLEIGGEKVVSMKELVTDLMAVLEIKKPTQPVPPAVAALAAALLETIQTVPLVSRDQVKLALKDNVCSNNAMQSILHLEVKSLADALQTYKKDLR